MTAAATQSICDVTSIARSGLFNSILWPNFWIRSDDPKIVSENIKCLKANKFILLKLKSIFCFDVLNNLMIMSTFGLCSPALAFTIVFVVICRVNVQLTLLGRFISVVGFNSESEMHYSLVTLADVYFPVREACSESLRLIIGGSAVFFSLICWDIAASEVGWLQSLWIPIVAPGYAIMLWAYIRRTNHLSSEDFRKTEIELVRPFVVVRSPMIVQE